MSELNEAIRKIVKGMVTPTIIPAEVVEFHSNDWTITCKINNLDIDEIRIKSVINTDDKGILVEPKVGSKVLLGKIDGKAEALVVLKYDSIVKYRLMADQIEFNGDEFSGIVKAEKVSDEIQSLKDEINDLKTILTTWTPVSQDGGAALKAAVSTWAGSQMTPTQQSDYENETVKHG